MNRSNRKKQFEWYKEEAVADDTTSAAIEAAAYIGQTDNCFEHLGLTKNAIYVIIW